MKKKILNYLKEILWVIAFVTVLQVGIVQAYHVPTGSMENTVMTGDFLLADKLTLGPRTPQWIGIPYTDVGIDVPSVKMPGFRKAKKGDVVVVEVPVDRKTPYVKRIVANGGDIVRIRDKQLYINGIKQEEKYVHHCDDAMYPERMKMRGTYKSLGNRDNWGPWTVPEGSVFLMGDNRDNSYDSRFFGAVSEKNIIGRARVVYMSYDRSGESLKKKVKLKRIGKLL